MPNRVARAMGVSEPLGLCEPPLTLRALTSDARQDTMSLTRRGHDDGEHFRFSAFPRLC